MTASVFVYGTLKPGLRYHALALQVPMLERAEASLEGFDLYHLEPENYPALVRGGGTVHGWRYRYADIGAALRVLDRLEGLHLEPPEYERVEASCRPMGEPVWVYLYLDGARLKRPSAHLVPGGVWTPTSLRNRVVPRGLG